MLRIAFAALAAVLLLALSWLAGDRWASGEADTVTRDVAAQAARDHAGLLASELQKFRLLPLVLVEYPDVAAAVAPGGKAAGRRLDRALDLLARRTDAAAIYVIDAQGRTVASSNASLPTSFVGQNYGFRPYFRDAMRSGASELFALGTVSGRPGLYLARRLGDGSGVVVVKVEFDRVEQSWSRGGGISFVTDGHGVILITSRPDWRFRTTHPLDPAMVARARETLQFGAAPLQPAPLVLAGDTARVINDGRPVDYRLGIAPVPLSGARLMHLAPIGPALGAAKTRARLWLLALLLVIGLATGVVIRSRERRNMQLRARHALEEEVAHRTAELRDANEQLRVESRQRAAADRRYRAAREELTQANRLGSIGQITAGVAHEINQPVAAIRTYAENAGLFLDRDQTDQVRGNLASIVELTGRIGTITAELRNFARKRTAAPEPVDLGSAIDGALLLAGDRIRDLVILDVRAPVAVIADRVRLEQILLNLLQNAAEALVSAPSPRIVITVRSGATVGLVVSDNGPGIDTGVAAEIFTPFVTSKPDGLGLGLGIARDIAREFGGELDRVATPLGGAAFRLTLKRG
ncbi:ATP-binding protein [Sphingomonas sp. AR_OL41]|uniref:sensor histidine kinase n=1 Tax=Sphingomonas sp. AR_OL41 TaxID=3042729 RepID=UPI0024807CBF|nr:ATP-binding protein [Sphingomonas sp. AR_OL41]MDH7970943.1 ATP-binding protein [Sphingomonas sp. AR_OL41]